MATMNLWGDMKMMQRLGRFVSITSILAVTTFSGSCNQHVFNVVPPGCHDEQQVVRELDFDKPADILVVIDNSGSMCEEQANLAANFFDNNCPIDDLDNIPERFLNPSDALLRGELADCGFVQILAAYENDFRLGVITTDVGPCDNRRNFAASNDPVLTCGDAVPNWGRRPQRGCLQPPPNNPNRFLQRSDENIGQKFTSILQNTRTYGTGYERGLDAMEIFLNGDTPTAECSDDRADFIREEAKLVVIFVTDEEDCSHGPIVNPDTGETFVDEFEGESCSNELETPVNQRENVMFPSACYELRDSLTPVSHFADVLKGVKGIGRELDVSVALIGGALREDNGAVTPAGCISGPAGDPVSGCFESRGNSSNPFGECSPDAVAARGTPCCQADPATRYFELGQALGGGQSLSDSICFENFRETMINIAGFIARTDLVQLSERPANEGDIVVRIIRANGDVTSVGRIPDGEDPSGQDGFQYDPTSGTEIRLYGAAVGQPGDRISVAAPVAPSSPACIEAEEESAAEQE